MASQGQAFSKSSPQLTTGQNTFRLLPRLLILSHLISAWSTHLCGHKSESVNATKQADSDADYEHDAGQGQDSREKGNQAKMGPAGRRGREWQLQIQFILIAVNYRLLVAQAI